jgi:FkbM family methyltransferase
MHLNQPYGKALDALRQNIEINNIQNISVHNVALGARNYKLDLFVPKQGNIGTSSFVWRYRDEERITLSDIDVVTGDEVIKKINPEKIDLIKIDVEGFEKDVLIGLKKSLKAFYPIMLIEVSKGVFSNINEFDTALDGYEVYKVSYDTHRFVFFNTPSYCLSKFDFNSLKGQENILCLPKNSLSSIKNSGMPKFS